MGRNYGRQIAKATRAMNGRQAQAEWRETLDRWNLAAAVPGWYTDAYDARFVRWWDGQRWTEHVRPRA